MNYAEYVERKTRHGDKHEPRGEAFVHRDETVTEHDNGFIIGGKFFSLYEPYGFEHEKEDVFGVEIYVMFGHEEIVVYNASHDSVLTFWIR